MRHSVGGRTLYVQINTLHLAGSCRASLTRGWERWWVNVKNDSKCTAMNVRNNGSRVSAQCQPESSRLYSSWSRCRPGAGQTAAGDTVTEVVVGPVRARQRQPTKIIASRRWPDTEPAGRPGVAPTSKTMPARCRLPSLGR